MSDTVQDAATEAAQADDALIQELQRHLSEQAEAVQKVQKTVMDNPVTTRALRVARDPRIGESLNTLAHHPRAMTVVYLEGAWLLVFIVWRIFVQPRRLVTRLLLWLLSTITFIGVSLAIPYWIFGEPYRVLLRAWASLVGLDTVLNHVATTLGFHPLF